MCHIILTIANAYDEETHQGGIALYFKHMSRGREVRWYDAHIEKTDELNSTISYRLMCATSDSPVSDNVSLYVISHSVGGTFAGFPADLLVPLLKGFLKYTVKLPKDLPVEKLSLIGCGTARGDGGATYIAKVGSCWKSGHPLKVVAWQAYVTLFDIRFLIKLLEDDIQLHRVVDAYIAECLKFLEGSVSIHARTLSERLSSELSQTLALHKNFRAFTNIFNNSAASRLEALSDQAILALVGKKVVKLPTPGNYFSNPPEGWAITTSLETSGARGQRTFGDSRDALDLLGPLNASRRHFIQMALRRYFSAALTRLVLQYVEDLFEWQYFPAKAKVSLLRHSAYEQ
ncbi:hypothetical protein GHU06_25790 [Pseudomonas aeruginosa]|uniref:hypothetical protein n=2 Tax=Pseudomonas aeruginosa TaxID=287 RepID=UPI00070A7498|nr:hypothetical protein [Pseudomonas aeruginosa]AWQ82368.1 hypothetical protein CSC33_1601 [Pseudomonas aeruginosa]KSJ16544.1 hypothetical protein AO994_08050 [Pseudomonas aeruginosa]MBF8799502.1 hypothetical protein [Pseudomonas aeruginosa]MBG4275908.1 hypothetical protein [Pseudomonas aeruginosa]MBG4398184.1 hypothetical protein [Pseudomonas aeruginosa]